MQGFLGDLRYGLRVLRKHPGFTAVAIITLALGIGANSAIFSVVHAVLLRPLPFEEPGQLVQVYETRLDRGWNRGSVAPANFWDFKELNRTLEDLGAYYPTSMNLIGLGYPERLDAGQVSAGFFRLLGARPVLGRTFAEGEDQPGHENRVALMASAFWRTRFAGDPTIVGRSLGLDGQSYTVVGVLPAGDPWLSSADVYVPYVRDPEAKRQSFELRVVGRLATGVSMAAARSDLERVARRLEELYPSENAGIGIDLAPASDWVASAELRLALWVLFGAVGVLLMIACINLANLLLAQATARQRETAVRAALGAARTRIIRQVLTEALLLGLAGAALGLLLALGVIVLVREFDPGGIPRLAEIGLDWRVFGFTLAAGLLTGVVSGLVPAFQISYSHIVGALREGGRGLAGARGRKRLRSGLVSAEVALSLVLLVGAGLLTRSFRELLGVERGFHTENRVVFAVSMPGDYDKDRQGAVRDQFLERVAAVPKVVSAAAVHMRPLGQLSTGMGILPAGAPGGAEQNIPSATWRLVTKDYFEALGIPVLKGRAFTEGDRVGSPWRAVVSERLAEQLWPGEDAVGRQARLWAGQDGEVAEIIGVVGSMRERGLEADPTLAVYLPYYGATFSPMHFVVHASSEATALIPTFRSMLSEIDPNLPISNVASLDTVVGNSIATRRFNLLLLGVFANVALVLALAGVYGVQAYSVARRTSEIGVRVALGASRHHVLWLVVRGGMRPALVGIGLGLLGAFALTRVMSGLLFAVGPSDPSTYVGVALMLAATALVSCLLPGLHALRVDPATALRGE